MNKIVQELRSLMHNTTTPSWANRAADEIERLEQQRDELLEALKEIAEYPRTQGHEFSAAGLRFVAREAIAKAGG